MPLKKYLVNKILNQRYRLNGVLPSTRLPRKLNLSKRFQRYRKYNREDLPLKVDLRNDMTTVEDQSSVASCTANALAGTYEYLTKKKDGQNVDVSRLFIYYNGRTQSDPSDDITDSGCTITDAIEALEKFGTCLESVWSYDILKVNERPSDEAYQAAETHKISEALQLNIDLYEMKSCLAQGFPFVFGLNLFTSFDKAAKKGVVPMPGSRERCRRSHGTHALLAVGYSDHSQSFIVRNSWGENWGDKGYCYIPYNYLANENYCFDVWTIRSVPMDDFGQEYWDNCDDTDYKEASDIDNDDNDCDHSIEDLEEDDSSTNLGDDTSECGGATDDSGGDRKDFEEGSCDKGDDFGFQSESTSGCDSHTRRRFPFFRKGHRDQRRHQDKDDDDNENQGSE